MLCLLLSIGMLGCGGSSTNGTLTLSPATATDKTGGVYTVAASATYTAPAGKVPNGAEIKFSWLATAAGSSNSTPGSATSTLGSNGVGTVYFDVNQATVPINIELTAKIGDLSQNSQLTIPEIVPFTAIPSVIAFAETDAASASQTITLTGTYLPYTATSSNLEINVSLNASTVTVSKTSVTGAIQKSTTITLSDGKGTIIQIPVSYY